MRLQVDAFPGRYFEGQVRFVSPAFRADQRALTIEASVPNPDDALKPGMFAAAEVMLPSSAPSLVVPSAAVLTDAGISHVFVVRGSSVEQRMITTGLSLGSVTEVLQGLSPVRWWRRRGSRRSLTARRSASGRGPRPSPAARK